MEGWAGVVGTPWVREGPVERAVLMPQVSFPPFLQQNVPFFIFLQRSGQQQITIPQGSSFFQEFQENARSGRIKPRISRTAQGLRQRIIATGIQNLHELHLAVTIDPYTSRMTVKQIIVGSLIGSTVVAIALHKLHQEKGFLFMARTSAIAQDLPQTASVPARDVPSSRHPQAAHSLG